MTKDEIQKVTLGTNEALRVTADGEFIWHPEADAMIENGDFTSSPAMRHILRALRKALVAPVQEMTNIERHEQNVRKFLGAQPAPVQDSTCNNSLREQGKAYPRTCRKCGKGPCIALVNIALDKKAENARELGLDYEPVLKDNSNYRYDPPVAEPVAWRWHQAPVKTSWGHDMVVADLAIDKDNTVSVYCERDQTAKVEAMFNPPAAPDLQAELEATNRQVEILSDALAESRREVAALKAVQEPVAFFDPQGKGFYWAKHTKITAPVTVAVDPMPLYTTPPAQPAPVQEPVAWICNHYEEGVKNDVDYWQDDIDALPVGTPLYTTPPAQRQWVGLTDEEIQAEWLLTPQHNKAEGVWFGRRLEAKLKEKNT
jgi:hypothetical protein